MAANALNKMRDAVGKKQSPDEFEHVKVPRHVCSPSNKSASHAHEPPTSAGGELRHFIDPGFAECNGLQTFAPPRRFHGAVASTSSPGRDPMIVLGPP